MFFQNPLFNKDMTENMEIIKPDSQELQEIYQQYCQSRHLTNLVSGVISKSPHLFPWIKKRKISTLKDEYKSSRNIFYPNFAHLNFFNILSSKQSLSKTEIKKLRLFLKYLYGNHRFITLYRNGHYILLLLKAYSNLHRKLKRKETISQTNLIDIADLIRTIMADNFAKPLARRLGYSDLAKKFLGSE